MDRIYRTLVGPFEPGMTPARLRTSLVIALSMTLVAVSYGSLSHEVGMLPWQTALLAFFVYGGASELLFVSALAGGAAIPSAALAGLVVNSRNFAYAMNVGQYAPRGWRRILGAHLIHDESMALGRLGKTNEERWNLFRFIGILLLFCWVGGALLGQFLAGMVDTSALGLDAAFPVILIAMVFDDLRKRSTLVFALLGALIAVVVTPLVPAGLGGIAALLALIPWFLAERNPR
ncbi:AzlC family ABC transporter permease [Corynebacterium sp. S7]